MRLLRCTIKNPAKLCSELFEAKRFAEELDTGIEAAIVHNIISV
jgi:hypothetical protein